jgi:hypothetical protein
LASRLLRVTPTHCDQGTLTSPSDLSAAANCQSTALSFTSDLATLLGNTTVVRTATCANGYAIGGGASTTTTQAYTCTGTAAGSSAWLPSPSVTRCQGGRVVWVGMM